MALYVNPENQKLLWNIINKHPKINEYFLNKPISNKHHWFQTCIEYIYENIKNENLNIETLQLYNKETLRYMLNWINDPNKNNKIYTLNKPAFVQESRQPQPQPAEGPRQLQPQPQYSRTMNEANSSQYISKSDSLNKNFSIRQKEYEDMIEKKAPETIDFRDKIDDEPISNMEEVLRTHLQMRENELKQYAPLPLVPENKKIIIDNNNDNVNINNITVEIDNTEETTIDSDSKTKKNVSWEDNEIESLKKQIRELIKKTDKMQEEIHVLKYKNIIEQEETTEITEKSI